MLEAFDVTLAGRIGVCCTSGRRPKDLLGDVKDVADWQARTMAVVAFGLAPRLFLQCLPLAILAMPSLDALAMAATLPD